MEILQKQVTNLIWRRHRRLFAITGGLSLLIALANNLIVLHTLDETTGHQELIGAGIHQWKIYNGNFEPYPFWLAIVFWMMGLLLMNQDLKDNFNQFLFSSGFSRQRIYWTKLGIGLGSAIAIVAVTLAFQYGMLWLSLPSRIGFQLAWPGLVTSWTYGLASSIGLFSLCWFAALIVGQSGALMVTIIGFSMSLSGLASIGEDVLRTSGLHLNGVQLTWLVAGIWLVAAVILFVWGSYLYRRLSLEHNGEYLLFPGLRVPVYIVFVLYVTVLNGWNGADNYSAIIAFIVSAAFGYFWLWRPGIMEKWHRWRSKSQS